MLLSAIAKGALARVVIGLPTMRPSTRPPKPTIVLVDNPYVKSLVYVAAFAPEVNETVGAFGDRYLTGH